MATLVEFNSSLETTRRWIHELMETMRATESKACRALRVVLHELRDHLTVNEAADLAAQLPLLLRGIYYEGWKPNGKPVKRRSTDEFIGRVAMAFKEIPYHEAERMVRDVFLFLDRRISTGEIQDIVHCLPKGLKELWPCYAGDTRFA